VDQKKKLYDYFWFDVPLIFEPCIEGYEMMIALKQASGDV